MPQALAWLPPPGKGDVESALVRLIEGWSEGWFVAPVDLRVQPRARGEFRALHWWGVTGAMVGSNADTEVQLGHAICGREGDATNSADREILRQMGRRLLEDLAAFLFGHDDFVSARAQTLSSDIPEGELFTVASVAGGWSLGLALSPVALVEARKRAAGTSHGAVPGSRHDALAPQVVGLGCHLGHARLAAGEVALLTAGDVIVLDGQPGVPLVLTIQGNACASGKAKIARSVEGASITIAERASLLRKVGNYGESKFGE